MNQFSLKLDHRLGVERQPVRPRHVVPRATTTQPFGTTSLNEALVPGFGRTVTTAERERRARLHAHVRLAAG